MLSGKTVLVTGGTGSLGKVLTRRLLSGEFGDIKKIKIFSRDEAKQHEMRVSYMKMKNFTDEVIYNNFREKLEFTIGDIRDYHAVVRVLRGVDIVFSAAALKQVPACEYFPYEAVCTNITGPENIIRAITEYELPVEAVVGISTDKACKPVNVMGMTKAIQERVFIRANLSAPETRFVCVRYGNVLASRGSVIPLFHEQIRKGGPITITSEKMTRFLLNLNQAVDTIMAAVDGAKPGEIFIPRVPAANMMDVAKALIGDRPIEMKITGIRPGEKLHESLISDEEALQCLVHSENYYKILPMLPELRDFMSLTPARTAAYSSDSDVMPYEEVHDLLERNGLLDIDSISDGELLR